MAVRNQKAKRRKVQQLSQERISSQRKAVSSPGRVAWEGTDDRAGRKGRYPDMSLSARGAQLWTPVQKMR